MRLRNTLAKIAAAHGVDISAIAIAWLLAHPAKIVPVLGTNKLDRIAQSASATSVEMDRQTWFEIYTAALGHEVA